MAIFARKLTDYLPLESLEWARQPAHVPPATVFLTEVVQICDSIRHCSRHFARRKSKEFTADSGDAFQRLSMSAFALLMSHFETFQKAQFAALINACDFMNDVNDSDIAKRLEKAGCVLSLQRILSGRGDPREPGAIVADALPGWHNPERVNTYYRVVLTSLNVFSNEVVSELELMWQLRHSIVHSGGVVTREDATKVAGLRRLSDKRIKLNEDFVEAVGHRLHIIVQCSALQLDAELRKLFRSTGDGGDDAALIDSIVGFDSPRRSWFRRIKDDSRPAGT